MDFSRDSLLKELENTNVEYKKVIIEYTDKKSAELHIRVEVPPTFLPHRAGVLYAGALRRHRSGYLNTEGCPVYQKHV